MSPAAAIHNEIFRRYVVICLVLLVAAGLLLLVLKWRFGPKVHHAWAAYQGWLVMVPIMLVVVFLGREATIVMFSAVAMWSFAEYATVTGIADDLHMTVVVYVAASLCALVTLFPYSVAPPMGWYGMFMVLPVFVVATILMIPILRNRSEGQLRVVSLSVLGFLYLVWMFGHLAFLANSRYAYGYLLFILLAVAVNDVAAYTFGKAFGRHPLRDQISPNKTWEGALGALAVSMALPWLLRFSFPHFAPFELVLVGLIVGVGGQLGDLSVSLIKRDVGVKDMGAAIPGHGGILDRVDSIIYVAPLFFHVARYFHGL